MNEPRRLSQQAIRVETGPVQFGNDWPGLFIRGDNALHYAAVLRTLAAETNNRNPVIRRLIEQLQSVEFKTESANDDLPTMSSLAGAFKKGNRNQGGTASGV